MDDKAEAGPSLTPGGTGPTRLPDGAELAAPAGMHPMGQLDARFPVAYEGSAPAALGVAVAWMAALTRRDSAGMAAQMHFPFAIFEGTEPEVVESADAFQASPPQSLNVTGKGLTQVAPGSYDLLDKLELLTFCPVAVGLAMSFTRYTKDGHKLVQCDGIFAVFGPRERAGSARGGNPMAGYVSRGVKSRLRVSEVTQEQIDRANANFPEFAQWAGGAVGEWDYTMNHPDSRVIHASPNKVHTVSGYIRYTRDHVEVSETRGLGVSVYRNNQWAPAGGMGNVMLHHDRSNSMPR